MPVTSARIAKAWARAAAKPVFTAPSCGRAPGVIKTGSTYRMVLAESDLPRQGSRFVVAEAAKPQGPCTVRGKGQLPGGGGRSQPPLPVPLVAGLEQTAGSIVALKVGSLSGRVGNPRRIASKSTK